MEQEGLNAIIDEIKSNLSIENVKEKLEELKPDDAIYVSNMVLSYIGVKSIEENFKVDSQIIILFRDTVNRANKEMKDLATKDPLTKLHNRIHLDEVFSQEQLRIKRFPPGYIFSLLMMDIDHFKKFNDTYGHVAGDEVLKNFSRIITENIRGTDSAFRYGGEEFIVFYSGTSGSEAFRAAKYLKEYMNDFKMEFTDENGNKHENSVTFSGGVTQVREKEPLKDAIDRADKLLYKAKENGRNNVVFEE